jgi:hypothetical protein
MFEMPTPPAGREENLLVTYSSKIAISHQLQSGVVEIEDGTKRDRTDENHESQYEDDQ